MSNSLIATTDDVRKYSNILGQILENKEDLTTEEKNKFNYLLTKV